MRGSNEVVAPVASAVSGAAWDLTTVSADKLTPSLTTFFLFNRLISLTTHICAFFYIYNLRIQALLLA